MKRHSFIYSALAGVTLFALASCVESFGDLFGSANKGDHISFSVTADEQFAADYLTRSAVDSSARAAISEDSRVAAFEDTKAGQPLFLSSSVTGRASSTTRGHRFGDDTNDAVTAFRVSAFQVDANISAEDFALLSPNFFYNLKAEKNGDEVFEIQREFYWPSSSEQLWFYAHMPCDDSHVQPSDQYAVGTPKVTFTVDNTVANQIDLMTANTVSTEFMSASGSVTKTTVPLAFRHELTAIRFVIGEQWLAGSIESVSICNVHGKGTLAIGDGSNWEWVDEDSYPLSANNSYTLTVNKSNLTGTAGDEFIDDTDLYFLMIPQEFDSESSAYIQVNYADGVSTYHARAYLKDLKNANEESYKWVRNTTVTYAISSHELTKLKVGQLIWPNESGDDAWSGPKTAFANGDAVGLYVVADDGHTLVQSNVQCTYDGTSWTVHHPEGNPVFKLPGRQYFFYYPYTDDTSNGYYPTAATSTDMTPTAFFAQLITHWSPVHEQNAADAVALNAQDLQVAKGVADSQRSSTVNAAMSHQMNIAKLRLGTTSVPGTNTYPTDGGEYTWVYQADNVVVNASSDFSVYLPYQHTDGYYYYVFAPVAVSTDYGVLLRGLDELGTSDDWTWELKTLDRGKLLTHTATSKITSGNVVINDALVIDPVSDLVATGSALTPTIGVSISGTPLVKGTDYSVTFKDANNSTVNTITVAGNYTAQIAPMGRYSGSVVPRPFTVTKAPKAISFAEENVSKTYGATAFQKTVTNTGTGTVTYSSDDTSVATVDETSGTVTITGVGTAKITATVADNDYDTYSTNTASYTLTVNKASSSMSNGSGNVSFTSSQGNNSQISRSITCTNCSVSGASLASGSGFSVSRNGNTVTITRTTTAAFSGTVTVTGSASNGNYNNPSNITISVSGAAYDTGVALSSSSVGMKVGTNGKAYATNASMPSGVSAVGVVTYKSGTSGYVVALWDCGGSTYSDGSTYTWANRANGLSGMTAVSGRTWAVGTKDQYATALTNDWSNNMTRITNAGGRSLVSFYYWSATESTNSTNARSFVSGDWYNLSKTNNLYVRPLFAF